MNHNDHVNLIKNGIVETDGIWADLGSGQGAFTLALADLMDGNGTIYSVDRDKGALRRQANVIKKQFPVSEVHYIQADFTQTLNLPQLDGIVMANSLHFIFDKLPVLKHITSYLKPAGRLILIEYNTNKGNRWVPHPLTYSQWEELAHQVGFASTELLMTRPSSFLGEFFSAVSVVFSEENMDSS